MLNIINISEQNEKNSNQILDYTKSVKRWLNLKTLVIKTLWKIILSDDKSGQYENNLMREFVDCFTYQIS